MRTFAWASLVTHDVWVPFDSTCGGLGRGLLAPWRARQGEAVWWVRTTTIKPQSFEIPLSELLPIHSTLQTVIKVGMYRTSEKCMHSTERKEHRLGGYVPLSSSSAAILNISAASWGCLLRLPRQYIVTQLQGSNSRAAIWKKNPTFLLHTDEKIKLRSVS